MQRSKETLKFERTAVFGIEQAIYGMRNPLESWHKMDSYYEKDNYILGPNDLGLAKRLISAGTEHRKFLRQIFVSVTITAPLYWYKEFDTYKINTTSNSTSTMHKITSKPITLDCFEPANDEEYAEIDEFIDFLEIMRQRYLETNDKSYWKTLIRWLPSSWLQTRTITMNYENILSILRQRNNHKLTEWHNFCDWAFTLPYIEEFYNA